MPEPKTEAEAIALLIRNTLELYMQMEVTSADVVWQDIAALNLLSDPPHWQPFKVGDRYYIGEPA